MGGNFIIKFIYKDSIYHSNSLISEMKCFLEGFRAVRLILYLYFHNSLPKLYFLIL